MITNMSGIYCIKNKINNKKYIGQSIDIQNRKKTHFQALKHNRHSNFNLQKDYNNFKRKDFDFDVLIFCEPFELTKYEQFFIDLCDKKYLYNICLECVDSTKGLFHTEETKRKISETEKGKIVSEYTKIKFFIGEKNPSAKLNENDVKKIKTLLSSYSDIELSKVFPVSRKQINNIRNKKSWRNIKC